MNMHTYVNTFVRKVSYFIDGHKRSQLRMEICFIVIFYPMDKRILTNFEEVLKVEFSISGSQQGKHFHSVSVRSGRTNHIFGPKNHVYNNEQRIFRTSLAEK